MSPHEFWSGFARVFIVWDSYGPGQLSYTSVHDIDGVVRSENFFIINFIVEKV